MRFVTSIQNSQKMIVNIIIVPLLIFNSFQCISSSDSTRMKPSPTRRTSPYHIGGLGNSGDTRIEIEVNYRRHKSLQVFRLSFSIPNDWSPHGSIMPSVSGSTTSIRHVPFSSVDQSSSSSSSSSSGRSLHSNMDETYKTNVAKHGRLIHVVNYISNKTITRHNACSKLSNIISDSWIALVDNSGPCKDDEKMKFLRQDISRPPDVVILYEKSNKIIEPSIKFETENSNPIVIWLPWKGIEPIVTQCYNSTGALSASSASPHSPSVATSFSSVTNNYTTSSNIPIQENLLQLCNISLKIYISPDDNFLNKTSVLFVSVSFILLMVISLAWLMFYYVQRFRYIHTKEQFSRRLAHMAKKAVAKIPVKTLKQGDKETDPEISNCAICIECYRPSDTVRILPCKHFFHKSCIDPWLLEQRNCPMCKLNILQAYGFMSTADSHDAASLGEAMSDDRLSEYGSSLEMHLLATNNPNINITNPTNTINNPNNSSSSTNNSICPTTIPLKSSTNVVLATTSCVPVIPSSYPSLTHLSSSPPTSNTGDVHISHHIRPGVLTQTPVVVHNTNNATNNTTNNSIDRTQSLRQLITTANNKSRNTYKQHHRLSCNLHQLHRHYEHNNIMNNYHNNSTTIVDIGDNNANNDDPDADAEMESFLPPPTSIHHHLSQSVTTSLGRLA